MLVPFLLRQSEALLILLNLIKLIFSSFRIIETSGIYLQIPSLLTCPALSSVNERAAIAEPAERCQPAEISGKLVLLGLASVVPLFPGFPL